jgi:hypothetical protein
MAGIFVLSLSHERINTALAGVFVATFGLTFFQGATLGSYHRQVTTTETQVPVVVTVPTLPSDDESNGLPSVDLGALLNDNENTVPFTLPFPWPPQVQPNPTIPQTFLPVPQTTWNPYQFVPRQGDDGLYRPYQPGQKIYVLPEGYDLQNLLRTPLEEGQ